MVSVENDVGETFKLTEFSKYHGFQKYGPVYPSSNEKLSELFSYVDVDNKEVLSVAGSGDHAFYAYDNGARRVDIFDINCLTRYYFYLRMWIIKYFDSFYFDQYKLSKKDEYLKNIGNLFRSTKKIFLNQQSLKNVDKSFRYLLSLVDPSSEEEKEVYEYWMMVSKLCKTNWRRHGFGYCLTNIMFNQDTAKINKITDLSNIKDAMNRDFDFYNIDIIKDSFTIDKMYDVIFLSNIVEYIYDVDKMNILKDNLYKLLTDDGCAVLSNVRGEMADEKKKYLSDVFSCEVLPNYTSINNRTMSIGTVLVKK